MIARDGSESVFEADAGEVRFITLVGILDLQPGTPLHRKTLTVW